MPTTHFTLFLFVLLLLILILENIFTSPKLSRILFMQHVMQEKILSFHETIMFWNFMEGQYRWCSPRDAAVALFILFCNYGPDFRMKIQVSLEIKELEFLLPNFALTIQSHTFIKWKQFVSSLFLPHLR
jgi:hypothetical protein